MALFIRQDEQRSELQKRLATELQDRAKKRTEQADIPDGVDDSQYIEGTKTTTSLAWLWVLIVIVSIGIALWLMLLSMSQ